MPDGKRAEYKNAVRSKQCIKKAYAALLNEKDVTKITVTDIVEKAGISRGTFYAHYADVHDLYNKLENDAIGTIMTVIDVAGITNFYDNPLPTLDASLRFIEQNKEYYRLLLNSAVGSNFINKLSDDFATRFADTLIEHIACENHTMVRSYLSFVTSGIRGVIFRWLDGTLAASASECALLMTNMMLGARPPEMRKKH